MEIKILLHEIAMESEILSSSFSNKVTAKKTRNLENHCSQGVRTWGGCPDGSRNKRQMRSLKENNASRERDTNKTGGGKGLAPPE